MHKLLTLLVEEVPTHQKILSGFLESEGYIVFTADNGTSALRFLSQFKPDILIVNLDLPGISGLELIQRIKSSKELATMPVVAINNSKTFRPSDALDAGASAILRKPINLPLLLNTLVQVISKLPPVSENVTLNLEDRPFGSLAVPEFA